MCLRDPLDDLPPASREKLLDTLQSTLDVSPASVENILRASEPFWNSLEEQAVWSTRGEASSACR